MGSAEVALGEEPEKGASGASGKTHGWLPKSAPEDLPVPAWFDAKVIIGEILQGRGTQEIADERGVKRYVLNYYLLSRSPEDWKEAQVMRALRRKEEAEEEMDGAGDVLAYQKAQGKLKGAQWELEKVCRRIYGEEPKGGSGVQVVIQVANLRAPVVYEEEKEVDGRALQE